MKMLFMPPAVDEQRAWPERLAQAFPGHRIVVPEVEEDVAREIVDADALYGWVQPELLPLARQLRWLHSPTISPPQAGFFYRELIEHPLVVTNPRGTFNDHLAQHAMMFVLGLARGLTYYMDEQRAHRWNRAARQSAYVDLASSTALVVGVGGAGAETVKLCAAFGMRVLGVDARWEHDVPSMQHYGPDDLDDLLPIADFVVVTVPHTPATDRMWSTARFQRMKRTAHFINVGRGKTVVLDDLVSALKQGLIAGCGMDVVEVEPLPADNELWSLPNVMITPHVGGRDADIDSRQLEILIDNIERFLSGRELRNVVDKANWF